MARCVHCLNPAGDTRDHAFPASWYPESTPGEVQRPTAPCCGPCNRGFGKLEGYLLGRIGLCLDPRNAESAGIPAKALRSVGIGLDSELTKREKRIRARLKAKLMSDTKPYREVAGKPGILPGFGPHIGFPVESQLAIVGYPFDSGDHNILWLAIGGPRKGLPIAPRFQACDGHGACVILDRPETQPRGPIACRPASGAPGCILGAVCWRPWIDQTTTPRGYLSQVDTPF